MHSPRGIRHGFLMLTPTDRSVVKAQSKTTPSMSTYWTQDGGSVDRNPALAVCRARGRRTISPPFQGCKVPPLGLHDARARNRHKRQPSGRCPYSGTNCSHAAACFQADGVARKPPQQAQRKPQRQTDTLPNLAAGHGARNHCAITRAPTKQTAVPQRAGVPLIIR